VQHINPRARQTSRRVGMVKRHEEAEGIEPAAESAQCDAFSAIVACVIGTAQRLSTWTVQPSHDTDSSFGGDEGVNGLAGCGKSVYVVILSEAKNLSSIISTGK